MNTHHPYYAGLAVIPAVFGLGTFLSAVYTPLWRVRPTPIVWRRDLGVAIVLLSIVLFVALSVFFP